MINLKSAFKSIGYAFSGLIYVVKTQNNARFHLLATIVVVLLSFWLRLSTIQWAFILIAISSVWITECFNTSLEELFDLVNPSPHPLVKNGKDSGAAAVLVAALLSVILGIVILAPPLFQKIQLLLNRNL